MRPCLQAVVKAVGWAGDGTQPGSVDKGLPQAPLGSVGLHAARGPPLSARHPSLSRSTSRALRVPHLSGSHHKQKPIISPRVDPPCGNRWLVFILTAERSVL